MSETSCQFIVRQIHCHLKLYLVSKEMQKSPLKVTQNEHIKYFGKSLKGKCILLITSYSILFLPNNSFSFLGNRICNWKFQNTLVSPPLRLGAYLRKDIYASWLFRETFTSKRQTALRKWQWEAQWLTSCIARVLTCYAAESDIFLYTLLAFWHLRLFIWTQGLSGLVFSFVF